MESKQEIGMSYVLFSRVYENSFCNGIYPRPKNRFRGYIFRRLYLNPIIANSGVVVRRDIFNKVGLFDEDPRLAAGEDYDMWLKIARIEFIDYVSQKPLLIYRARRDSISGELLHCWRRIMLVTKKHAVYAGKRLYIYKILRNNLQLFKAIFYR